ncbi:hypothetical protein [Flavobacterium sp. FlaQc-48]|uniref:hypothetical protein n=1 Tax=Flavobacterium sp. FlaQc-48 TaxID=3374181 RepID=UPI0037584721
MNKVHYLINIKIVLMCNKDDLKYRISEVINSIIFSISNITDEDIEKYATTFREVGFVQIPSIIDSEALANLYQYVIDNSYKYFVSYQGKDREYFGRSISGHRFKRLFFKPGTEYDKIALANDKIWQIFSDELEMMSVKISELIRPIMISVGENYRYDYGSIFYYGENDFIGLHHDSHYGDMINAQFPMSMNVDGCIRIKYNDELIPFYDNPGCLNILGAHAWHDVPTISKIYNDKKPQRFNFTLVYMPIN